MTRVARRFTTAASRPAVLLAALVGAVPASAAPTPPPRYLFSIPTASGSLTGRDDQHLTLRLTGARDYLTRFTDRPLRQAFAVANVDFARRFTRYFASSRPNAVLSYTPVGTKVPVSIVVTLGQPRWNGRRHTWTFSATRIRKQPDDLPDTTVHITPPAIPNPRGFTHGTLMIDGSGAGTGNGIFAGDTSVELADGTTLPISQVRVGEEVRSASASGGTVAEPVTWTSGAVGGASDSRTMISLSFVNGRTLVASPGAVLLGRNGGIGAANVLPGDWVQTASGQTQDARLSIGSFHGSVASLAVAGSTETFYANGVLVFGRPAA